MRLYIDTADLEEIRMWSDILPLEGVTTNPTLLAEAGLRTFEAIERIFAVIGDASHVHVQVVSQSYAEMVKEAREIKAAHDNIFVKIPVTRDGLKAIKHLSEEGMKITATAVATSLQGLVAAKAGAAYVAPYINRIDNLAADGVDVARALVELLEYHRLRTRVIGASYKNVQQVLNSLTAGIHSLTLPPNMLAQLINHPLTETSSQGFFNDYVGAFKSARL